MESQEAAKNIAEIAAVEGVDCIQMGPLDLRSDMGLLRMPNDERPTEMLRYAPSNIPSSESLPSSMAAHVTKSTHVALEETLNVRDYCSQ
jgi:2-keto-3-deoxy-L-rhamnonate aldolase RhmA